jgi:hypothetical protein
MPSELSLRAQGRDAAPLRLNATRSRRLMALAGDEALAADLNGALARRELANVEMFYDERLRTDSRVAGRAKRLAEEDPTATPLLADTCAQYQAAANGVGQRRFLPTP